VSQSGIVNSSGDQINVTDIDFVVAKAPGAGSIDLNQTSVELIGANGQETFQLDEIATSNVEIFTSPNDDTVVLTDSSDRAEVSIDLDDSVEYGNLSTGDQLSVTFTTASGATTTSEIRVPTTLTKDQTSVRL
jgi:flagellin FlaB